MQRKILRWQIAGFIFTVLLGMLLHMLYKWTGQSLFVAWFCAVNESIWEHMKLLFFPAFLFSFIEYLYIIRGTGNYWFSKLKGIWLGTVLIPVMFYTFLGITGKSPEWFNIVIYFVSISAVFISETRWLLQGSQHLYNRAKAARLSMLAIVLLCLTALIFVIFTFMPPNIPLFQDLSRQ